MLENLMNNPIAWLVLSLISVISFIFGIYTWITGKKRKEISVSDISHVIIKAGKSQIPKLDVIYDGVCIENLTATKFYVWNSGNDVINASDVVQSKKLSIYGGENIYILDAQILKVVERSNNICIANINPDKVVIDFDYLDQGEGCLIQLLHTGNAEELHCDCKIKGGKKVRYCYEDGKKTVSKFSEVIATLTEVLAVVLTLMCLSPVSVVMHDEVKGNGVLITSLIFFFVGLSAPFVFNFFKKKYNQTFHRKVPSALKGKQ